jgi:hypothetical protein
VCVCADNQTQASNACVCKENFVRVSPRSCICPQGFYFEGGDCRKCSALCD